MAPITWLVSDGTSETDVERLCFTAGDLTAYDIEARLPRQDAVKPAGAALSQVARRSFRRETQ